LLLLACEAAKQFLSENFVQAIFHKKHFSLEKKAQQSLWNIYHKLCLWFL